MGKSSDIEDKFASISEAQLQDLITRLEAKKLANEERLYREISLNPNYPRYLFIENLFRNAGIKDSFYSNTVLNSVKAKGIRELIIKKFDSFDNIIMATAEKDIKDIEEKKNLKNEKEIIELAELFG